MEYELKTYNGYDMVIIDNLYFMFDMGRNTVFFNPSISYITINNKRFAGGYDNMPRENRIAAFGYPVDGFIGPNVIRSLGLIEIDRINKKVVFENSNKPIVHSFKMNLGRYETKINGVTFNSSYFDTGAPIVGVDSLEALEKGTLINEHHIEQTNFGPKETKLYKGILEFNGVEVETEMFYLHDGFCKGPYKVFFGLNHLAKKYYVIDFKKGIIYFE